MKIIPTQAIAAQSLLVSLDGQACQIDLQQTDFGLFANFWLNNPSTPTLAGVLCQDRNRIIRDAYFGFAGDLGFVDQQGTTDPYYTGLGSRYLLYYLESGTAASGGISSGVITPTTTVTSTTISGGFTLAANATSTTVSAPGTTTSSQFVGAPTPLTADAANDMATTSYVMGTGQFVITHANNSRTDRTFSYTIEL